MARAPALQAGGQEFDSPYLHQNRFNIYLKHIEKYIDKLMKGKLAYESMQTIKPKESELNRKIKLFRLIAKRNK